MPAYFTLGLRFNDNLIKHELVEKVYSVIMSCGFGFKSGFYEEVTLDEIIKWNQRLLEHKFILKYKQHHKHGYKQILFDNDMYSEVRGYWIYRKNNTCFNLIIPEGSILNREGGDLFIESKVFPVKRLALELWNSGIVDAIQTSLELDFYDYDLSAITAGKNISINPFAILPKIAFEMFPKKYFDAYKLTELNNGIFIQGGNKAISHFRS